MKIKTWNQLKEEYNRFDHTEDNFFFPEDGSHPVYNTYIEHWEHGEEPLFGFAFGMNYSYIEYLFRINDRKLDVLQCKFINSPRQQNMTKEPFAAKIWERYFESEAEEMLKDMLKDIANTAKGLENDTK